MYIIMLPYDYNEPNNYFIVSQYFASEEKSEPGEMLLWNRLFIRSEINWNQNLYQYITVINISSDQYVQLSDVRWNAPMSGLSVLKVYGSLPDLF